MTDLGPVPDDHPQVLAHRAAMAKDPEAHKVKMDLDGGGTWTFTCETCAIRWRIEEKKRSNYHGD